MYKSVVLCAVLYVAAVIPASAQDVSFGATWWRGLSDDQQIYTVEGAIQSFPSGFINGKIAQWDHLMQLARSAKIDPHLLLTLESLNVRAAKAASFPKFSKTFGTYVHGIGDFYNNYPNASSADVGDILQCLADVPIESCDQVAKENGGN